MKDDRDSSNISEQDKTAPQSIDKITQKGPEKKHLHASPNTRSK